MPIPAQNPMSYDKLLLKGLCMGASTIRLQLNRYAEVGSAAVEQSVRAVLRDYTTSDADAATLIAGIKTLVADYNSAKGRPAGDVINVQIQGTATEAGIGASVRFLSKGAQLVVIPDAYAEAGSDPAFATLIGSFLALVAQFNSSKKLV